MHFTSRTVKLLRTSIILHKDISDYNKNTTLKHLTSVQQTIKKEQVLFFDTSHSNVLYNRIVKYWK